MLIYQAKSDEFCRDVQYNRIADIMEYNFTEVLGRSVSDNEFRSWQNSLNRVKNVIDIAGLHEAYIALEYQIPYNQSRIDCLFFGNDHNGDSNVLVMELKQWDHVNALEIEGNFVETFVGGGVRTVPHPSQQVKGYHNYLLEFVNEFENEPKLNLHSFAYCHNYSSTDKSGLFNPIYNKLVDQFPIYCREDSEKLANKLKEKLENGNGTEIFNRFMQSKVRPSKKLLDNVSGIIKNEVKFSLLNEQLVAKNLIWHKIRRAEKKGEKSVILVKGGPGTGKSIIALNILAEVAQRGKSILMVSKSKPFRDGLQALVGRGSKNLFISPYSVVPAKMEEDNLDVLLIDEAHRLERKNVYRMMSSKMRSDMPQVEQLIRSAKTTVFFIDDKQRVRSQEIGNSDLIYETAEKFKANVDEVELVSQFRCMGSNDYLEWIESILGYTNNNMILKKSDLFDFKIVDSPEKLYSELEKHEIKKPNSARLVAGFCWPWSEPNKDGTLVSDVKIGDFEMPWETKGDHGVGEFPPWYKWAYKPKGFEQVGCIYTSQGFEFDYIGVIIGPDLTYNADEDKLTGDLSQTKDPTLRRDQGNFSEYVRNIYRVLLSRGMKGCYVYFVDKETEKYFRSRIEN